MFRLFSKGNVINRINKNLINGFNKKSFSTPAYDPSMVRNFAIIAHVDHGKTTLMDKLLQYCGNEISTERAMDSNEHEKERGITITSKYTRLTYGKHTLHVVDTPGHADFGGEVERILNMVDGVILLVDATEGPMAQTKFVLSKALAANKKSIVVLNKVDRENHRAQEVESEILDLFCALSASEELLDYPLMYASAKQGWVTKSLQDIPGKEGVKPLLDMIVNTIPPPNTKTTLNEPFALSVNTISTDNHLGRIVTGKIQSGSVKMNDKIHVLSRDGKELSPILKITKLFYLQGLNRVDVEEAHAGEIISLAGSTGNVTDTVCSDLCTKAIETVPISPPVISMTFAVNDSPLCGKDGNKLTSTYIKERLFKEIENNVTLTLAKSSNPEAMDVQGRGELQIGILIETMRREGFEMTICPPRVLSVVGEDGISREPFEEVTVDIDPEMQGPIIENMSKRNGDLIELKNIGNRVRLVFVCPSRGMMGFRHETMSITRGNSTVNSCFLKYDRVDPSSFSGMKKGKLVSMETGKSTGYSLMSVAERGSLFVSNGEEVYEGMVVGENSKTGDMDVNPCKLKKLSNVRSTGAEEKVSLSPPIKMSVEEMISYMDQDEVIEVTPKNIRLRKRILDSNERARYNKTQKGKA